MIEIAVTGDVHIHTAETKKEISVHTIRTSNTVSNAKKRVKDRDKVCKCCGDIGINGHLEIHHIFPVAAYKELAADESNMVTLCPSCHARYHNRYELEDVNPITFAEFLKKNCNHKED